MIVGCEYNEKQQSIIVSYYNRDGKISLLKKRLHKSDLFNWQLSKNPTSERNWDGRYIRRVPCKGKWISQFRIEELIKSKFSIEEINTIYDTEVVPIKSFLDIEIELIDDSFPEASKAKMPVNLITFCNDKNKCFVLSTMKESEEDTFGEKELSEGVHEYFSKSKPLNDSDANILHQKFDIKYIRFSTEKEMMTFFFEKVLNKISFITGWNVIKFDWAYLINRCKNIGIDPFKSLISTRIVSKRTQIPLHTGILDYMEMVMQWKPYKVIENYTLNYFSNLALGVTKLKSKHASMREAQKDVFDFVKYNIIDTILVKMIDDKIGLIDVALSLSSVARVEINRVLSPVHITELLICREFLKSGLKMAKDGNPQNVNSSETYAGAYVMPVVPGHYDLVACYDFASMYPNIQMQFNISPDSFMGNVKNESNKKDNIFTKNDTIFSNSQDSVTRTILNRLYNERVKTKKQMKQL